jgi:superoxide dismutase, Fe-Mn family
MAYSARSWTLNLKGLSKDQLDVHFALYQGYVTNTNRLNDTIAQMIKDGKNNTPDCAELKRRLGFEYNGMVLQILFRQSPIDHPTEQRWCVV